MDSILRNGYNMIFCIGGDGTMRGAMVIFDETRIRKLPIVVCTALYLYRPLYDIDVVGVCSTEDCG